MDGYSKPIEAITRAITQVDRDSRILRGVEPLVELIESERVVEANVAAIRSQDEAQERLLDELA